MKKRLTDDVLALAYEIRCEYRWTYERIAEFIGCDSGYLKVLLKRKIAQ